MSQAKDPSDPKGLIRESYVMDVADAECRSIFLDWALSLQEGQDQQAAIRNLLEQYGNTPEAATHPMTALLREGLQTAAPKRRGRSAPHRHKFDEI